MRRIWPFLAAGGGVYLLVLLLTFPATHPARYLEEQVEGLSMQSVSGTLLSGQAARISLKDVAAGPVSWTLRPAGLLRGRLEYRLHVRDEVFRGEGNVGVGLGGNLIVHDLVADLVPDPWVNHFSPLPVITTGSVSLQVDWLEMVNGFPSDLAGRVDWVEANIIEPVELSLGQVAMSFEGTADILLGTVTGNGETVLTGDISLTPSGDYRLDLLLTPGATASPEFVDALSSIAQAETGGAYRITDGGRL